MQPTHTMLWSVRRSELSKLQGAENKEVHQVLLTMHKLLDTAGD